MKGRKPQKVAKQKCHIIDLNNSFPATYFIIVPVNEVYNYGTVLYCPVERFHLSLL